VMSVSGLMNRSAHLEKLFSFSAVFADVVRAFSWTMLPWALGFALVGGLFGRYYSRSKRAEGLIQENEARFRNMAESAQDAIIITDDSEKITFWNAAAERIFGFVGSEALGASLETLVVPNRDKARYLGAWRRIVQEDSCPGKGKVVEVTARRKGGGEFPAELSISCFLANGRRYTVGLVRDISEAKRAETELRKQERLQGVLEMAGAACHELNNPLQVIIGYADLLLGDVEPEGPLYTHLLTIRSQVENIGEITRKIMKISRYETRDYAKGSRIVDIDRATALRE